ncbi:MAG: glycosyl hydrolase [Robiginitomaculum sp.]|nr:MAG: glycosyl hydrolase [Robiginitomaculum sp.]
MLTLAACSPATREQSSAQSLCAANVGICETGQGNVLAGDFALIHDGMPLAIVVAEGLDTGIVRAAKDLQDDLGKIGDHPGMFGTSTEGAGENIILIGDINSPLIQNLVAAGKLDVSGIEGKWEGFSQSIVDAPLPELMPNVKRALVITGSDKRGTIYGIYDLSRRAGVSPWYWWADVPIAHKSDLYASSGQRVEVPKIKYRGIFLNDENPALYGWVHERYESGFGHEFYADVFELILRNKGNYLWPAMWGKAFYDDDPLNAQTATEYGIVIGTSHHEPLARAHTEWERYGQGGAWNFDENTEGLTKFWREGMERKGDHEGIVSIGMRGDGDEAMTEGTAIDLLERIVAAQREIITDVTGKPASETPQIWALYKEVQDYYDQGMEVPDDVTLLFSDDNWGNIRRLPKPGVTRPGGYGVYYHFDYVGGPRNYKWLNTTQIERVWEQMHLADAYGAHEVWIANVGDLKPMELPISFFLDYAWNPDAIPLEKLPAYTTKWAQEQFGETHAQEIAGLLDGYTKLNARRKPELVEPGTYSLVHYNEADRVMAEWQVLADTSERVKNALPDEYQDAYAQLVWYPIQASLNLNALYIAAAKNALYAKQKRASTNTWAAKVQTLFDRDAELARFYHEDIADGKWNHMMSQTHIGYTYWQQPEHNNIPNVQTLDLPVDAKMCIAIEGSEVAWGHNGRATLAGFDVFTKQSRYFEIYNEGQTPFTYVLETDQDWVKLSSMTGSVDEDVRIVVEIDWAHVPADRSTANIEILASNGDRATIGIAVYNPANIASFKGYMEADGYIAVDAQNYTRAVGSDGVHWETIPNLSRTGSGVSPMPVTAPAQRPGTNSPHLEYDIYVRKAGDLYIDVTLAPTLDFLGQGGLRYGVSIDDQEPIIVNINKDTMGTSGAWNTLVANYAHVHSSNHTLATAGAHTVKIWMVDPALVFQRVTVMTNGELPYSYLGPQQSVLVGD